MISRKLRMAPAVAALAAVALVGCDDGGLGPAGGDATVRVLLTDAPSDYIANAWVDIGRVEIVPMDGEPIMLNEDGTDGMVDLLELQNAATAELASMDIEAGEYSQIRMFVEDAAVDLVDGTTFRDGSTSKSLKVPSGAIRLNLGAHDGMHDGAGLEIVPGENVLVVDFDVSQSYVLRGNPETPAGIHGVIFKPMLRVTVNDVAGSISGQVTTGLDLSTVGLTVTAELVEGTSLVEEYQTTTATAVTVDEGLYTVHFLVPGTYTVSVTPPEGYAAEPATTEVVVGEDVDVTEIDFAIVEPATSG